MPYSKFPGKEGIPESKHISKFPEESHELPGGIGQKKVEQNLKRESAKRFPVN